MLMSSLHTFKIFQHLHSVVRPPPLLLQLPLQSSDLLVLLLQKSHLFLGLVAQTSDYI